jgi:hypothetical protein
MSLLKSSSQPAVPSAAAGDLIANLERHARHARGAHVA